MEDFFARYRATEIGLRRARQIAGNRGPRGNPATVKVAKIALLHFSHLHGWMGTTTGIRIWIIKSRCIYMWGSARMPSRLGISSLDLLHILSIGASTTWICTYPRILARRTPTGVLHREKVVNKETVEVVAAMAEAAMAEAVMAEAVMAEAAMVEVEVEMARGDRETLKEIQRTKSLKETIDG
jgi:hypothetical protein